MKTSPIIAVTVTVWLGLVSALLLKEAADTSDLSRIALLAVLFGVLVANALRFLIWGHVYKHHPVSSTYPLGSTIFPLILIIDHVRYGAPISIDRVFASLMIMAGVAILSTSSEPRGSDVAN